MRTGENFINEYLYPANVAYEEKKVMLGEIPKTL